MEIDKSTTVSVGLVIVIVGGVAAMLRSTSLMGVDINTLDVKQEMMRTNTDKIPGIELDVHKVMSAIERLEKLNNSALGWKKPDHAQWCSKTERLNDGWVCADPYEVRRAQ